MSTEYKEVFSVLKNLRGVDASDQDQYDTNKVSMVEVDPVLIEPFEPGFVDGYKLATPTGKTINLKEIMDAHIAGENILLVGPSGTGKSTIAFHINDQLNEKTRDKNREIHSKNVILKSKGEELIPYNELPYGVSHYACHEATRTEELIGSITIKTNDDGTRSPMEVSGAVVEAWTQGKILILEEMDFAPPGVWGQTHHFFDGRTKRTTVYINGPRAIHKHERFRIIATANTLGRGENQLEFSGTQLLNMAFLNRFTYVVKVGFLEADQEINLITAKSKIDKAVAGKMVEAANKSREMYNNQTLDTCISTRDLLSWARESVREEKRVGGTTNLSDYWKNISVPSAYPSFISRIADEVSSEALSKYLSLR